MWNSKETDEQKYVLPQLIVSKELVRSMVIKLMLITY